MEAHTFIHAPQGNQSKAWNTLLQSKTGIVISVTVCFIQDLPILQPRKLLGRTFLTHYRCFFKLSTSPWRRIEEWMYSSTHYLISALDGGEWSVSRPVRFTPRERAPGTHWIGGWVGPRFVLGAVVKRNIPSPRRELNLKTPTAWSLYRLSYHGTV
jgi:hypothetical protein